MFPEMSCNRLIELICVPPFLSSCLSSPEMSATPARGRTPAARGHSPPFLLANKQAIKLCLTIVCHARGLKGVALTDALDSTASCPVLPQYGSPEYDNTFSDRLHASIPALLSASAAQDTHEAAETVPAILEVWQQCHMFVPPSRDLFWEQATFMRSCS